MGRLLLLFILFYAGGLQIYAQVGIGTDVPNPSSQLEIVAQDRGVLIPQVSLTGTTDQTTISSGNIESLLVYNTQTTTDVIPGYYYWFEGSWKRITTSADLGDGFSESITTLEDNGDGTFTYVSEDGTITNIDLNKINSLITVTDNGDGSYSFEDQSGNLLTRVETGADSNSYNNSNSGLTSDNVQSAIDELATDLANTTDVLVDNGDGTFTHTAVDGTEVIFDANTTALVDHADGTYELTNADGTTITVDTNAGSSAYDNINSGLTAGNVQDAIDEVVASLDSGGGVSLIDNGDGTVSLVSEDGTALGDVDKTSVSDNGDGTYTIDSGDGTPVIIDTNASELTFDNSSNGFTSTDVQGALEEIKTQLDGTTDILVDNGDGTFTHTAVDGTVVAFDANTTALLDNADGTYELTNADGTTITVDTNAGTSTYDNSTSGLAAGNVQDAIDELVTDLANTTDVLVDNGDGTFTHTTVDGTVVAFDANTTTVTSVDGVYTFTDGTGNEIATIDTNASASAYDNSTSGLTADNVQGAIDEVVATLDSGGGVSLIDNGDGTVSLVSEDGTALGDVDKTSVSDNGNGTYTIDSGDGTPVIIDTNASALTFDNSSNGFISTDVQGALEEIKTQLDGTTDILVDNEDGTFTHTAVDGTVVKFDANTTALVDNADGTYTLTDGTGSEIATIDTNASGSTYDNSTSGLTAGNVQDAIDEVVATLDSGGGVSLIDNGDGTVSLVSEDGTALGDVDKTSVSDNGNGTYTIDSGDGTPVIIDTNASGSTYDNSTSGLTAGNVQDAIDELVTDLANTTDVLVDNTDGTFTHTAVDGSETTIKSVMPKFFYMPSIIFDTSTTGTGFTRDLHSEYINQFSTPVVSSGGATSTIPTLGAGELEYHITYYDTTVFEGVSIDSNGVLTYNIIGNATPASFMNIVFVVK